MIDITEELQDVVPPHVIEQILKAKPYSMTSGTRLAHTYQTVQELDVAGIEGDIVECGVWKGGQIISAWLANTQSKRKSNITNLVVVLNCQIDIITYKIDHGLAH